MIVRIFHINTILLTYQQILIHMLQIHKYLVLFSNSLKVHDVFGGMLLNQIMKLLTNHVFLISHYSIKFCKVPKYLKNLTKSIK